MSPVAPMPGGPGPGPRPLAASLDRLTASFGAPPASVLTAVFGSWPGLVGEGVAAHAQPLSVRRGVLSVAVDDPAWATQLRWLEAELLARLAEVAGPGVIREIRVRVVIQ